ncbi:AmmeMemoRadiSam system protein B [Myxococcota bacterium]|nr:AmmeMemoRadiSam system protein B [Myxococcota bacterium]
MRRFESPPPISWISPGATVLALWVLLLFSAVACSDETKTGWDDIETPDFSGPQPGADDPDARMWMYADDFYPGDPVDLYRNVVGLMRDVQAPERRRATAVLTPHASLRYSGVVQAEVLARVEVPGVVIVLASDHDLKGSPMAVWDQGPWLIPGYAVPVDRTLVTELQARIPELVAEEAPFESHPAELQVVFLPYVNPDARIIVIAFADNSRNHFKDFTHDRVNEVGAALAAFMQDLEAAGEDVLLLTTTDLVHREPLEIARAKDAVLRDYVAALDVQGLYDYVTGQQISICGEIPTAIMMSALRVLGHTEMEIIAESDSYEGNGNAESVIGYLGGIAWK